MQKQDDGTGSSPLTRGALRGEASLRGPRGLIPADAGSTTPADGNSAGVTAHPR